MVRKRTLAEQAARLGITGVALGRYERGKRHPGPKLQRKIYKDLGVTPNQLLGIKGDR